MKFALFPAFADAMQKNAKRFQVKNEKEKIWNFQSDE